MKKILVLTNHSYMLWRFRRHLLLRLKECYDVVISTPFVGHEEDFSGLGFKMVETPLERRGINPITDVRLLRFYDRLVLREKPDMVLTYSIKPNIYGGLICQLRHIPYCANVQGLGTAFQTRRMAAFVKKLYAVAFKKAKTVFFENVSNAQLFREEGILDSACQTLLPGAGVDLNHFWPAPYRKDDETVRFLYLGRIMREKGIDEMIDAFRKLHGVYGDKVALDIVGFYEEDYSERIQALTRECNAVFHGFSTDPRTYYSKCSCVVMPSYHEGMSNVLLEGAAMARPLITCDIFGCKEAVDPGKNGYLCKVRDAQSLFEAMDAFVKLTWDQREQMGLEGRRKMEAEFDREKVVIMTVNAMEADWQTV